MTASPQLISIVWNRCHCWSSEVGLVTCRL